MMYFLATGVATPGTSSQSIELLLSAPSSPFPLDRPYAVSFGNLRFERSERAKTWDSKLHHLRLIGRLSVGLPLRWIAAGNAVGLGTNANATSRCTSSILRGEHRRTTKNPKSFIRL